MEKFWSFVAFFINMFGWTKWKIGRTLYEMRARKSVKEVMCGSVTLPSATRHTRLPDGGMKVEYLEHGVLNSSKTEIWSAHDWGQKLKVAGLQVRQ